MKRMGSPSAVGVAVATAKVDLGATAMTTTGTKVAAAMVRHVQIPSRYLSWDFSESIHGDGLTKWLDGV
jgi:hypothetical protein